MAILRQYPSIEVYIESDGVRLQEFDSDGEEYETNATTTTKYIEAKSAADFAVQLRLHRPFSFCPITFKLFIDGRHIRSRTIGDIQYQRAGAYLQRTFDSVVSRIADGQCTRHKFCFSELHVGERPSTIG